MDGQFVAETRNRLTSGIAARIDGRARTRDQIRLASLIMATGDPIEAAALGTQALDWAGPYTPRRRRPARTTPVTVDENCPILYRPPPKPDPLPPPARAVDPDEPPPF